MNHAQLKRIRWAVRATLILGVAASVTANVLHARQNPIAQAIAAWPPLALLLTVELISRVPIHRRWLAAVRVVATATIAGIAAWVSYWHMAGVAARYGEEPMAAHLIPLSVDGLVVVASVCLVELGGRLRETTKIEALVPALGTPTPTVEPAKTAAAEPMIAQVTAPAEPTNPAPVDEAGPRRPTRAEIEAERAARRADALAALARPEADPAEVAADAGVSVGTLQRWADDAAKLARRPRGGPRKPAPEGGSDGLGGPHPRAETTGATGSEGVRRDGRRRDVRGGEGEVADPGDRDQLGESGGRQGRHDHEGEEVGIGAR